MGLCTALSNSMSIVWSAMVVMGVVSKMNVNMNSMRYQMRVCIIV